MDVMEEPQMRQITLAQRPAGLPGDDTWTIEDDAPMPVIGDGEVLVKVLYISIDPAMRSWLYPVRTYIDPVNVGDVMRAGAIGVVVESRSPNLAVGDHVFGMMGWAEYVAAPGKAMRKVSADIAPLTWYLGVLGITGLTAYFGLLEVGHPQPGQTVLVSGAAGAVGSIAGQIARLEGCRAVGIAGGPEKCARLTDLFGFDAAIDYKNENLHKRIKATCPDRVDVFFDNVGGETLDAALRRLARGARVVICGAISTYNDMASARGPSNYMSLLTSRARMEGFVVFDYAPRYQEAIESLAGWVQKGSIKHNEHIVEGIERCPEALRMLFTGANQGKLIVQVAEA